MSLKLHIVDAKSRSFQCDVAGCRNRTTHLISKRGDVSSRPLHLCDDCIRGLYALIEPESPTIPVDDEEPIPEPDHLRDGGTGENAMKKQEPKTESKPNKAKKAPAKGGKK